MASHTRSPTSDEEGPPSKVRRTTRACLQCRSRKQRCLPVVQPDPDASAAYSTPHAQAPCQRCRQLNTTCSFETDQPHRPEENPTPSKMATIVVDLQRRVNEQEERIAELEKITGDGFGTHVHGNGTNGNGDARHDQDEGNMNGLIEETPFENELDQPYMDRPSSAHLATNSSGRPSPSYPAPFAPSYVTTSTTPHAGPAASVSPSTRSRPDFTMSTLELGPPIATLRSLGALPTDRADDGVEVGVDDGYERYSQQEDERSRGNQHARPRTVHNHPSAVPTQMSILDPIARGVMSRKDAVIAIETFFNHCHSFGPVLDEKLRKKGVDLRFESPTLFLTICTIGARFWEGSSSRSTTTTGKRIRSRGLHPSFLELTTLLDISVSQLLLRPTPSDVTLDSIRALLLYAQWMPVNRDHQDPQPHTNGKPTTRSRYNDISAWAVLGLAARYALFLGLDRLAVQPFQVSSVLVAPGHTITESDMSRLRVWHNLITCDCNLMLTSGLPASLDPAPAVAIGKVFAGHQLAQQPGDLRVTALVELVGIAHRAIESSARATGGAKGTGPGVGRVLEASCLRKANFELDEWEVAWLARLKDTAYQYNALPFTSIRWYRLSLNSAALGPLLSPSPPSSSIHSPQQRNHLSLLQSLEISLTAASQILFALSKKASTYIWTLNSQDRSSFPRTVQCERETITEEGCGVDEDAVERLSYAVDYTWISLTFSVTFLVLCYVRGMIGDDLGISILSTPYRASDMDTQTHFPHPARPHSILACLVRLAQGIFDRLCRTSSVHPARDYQPIVNNAAALISNPSPIVVQPSNDVDATQTRWDNVETQTAGMTNNGGPSNGGVLPSGLLSSGVSEYGQGDAQDIGEGEPMGLQGLFDLMSNSGMEWPGYIFGGTAAGGGDLSPWNV
nr:uncharacterized protein CI109_002838 [Kwoniella shandongensis]KAA5528680.1 hypothetical protein CI109_002838 [Kwoniella shandongensis]